MNNHFIKISFVLLLAIEVSCTSSDNNNSSKEKMKGNMFSKSLSHGTAEIAGTVISLKEKNGQQFYVVRVDTVLGYGAGTRPIPSGVELEFKVNNSVDKQLLTENSAHHFTLRFMNERFGGEVDHPWEIIKLMK